jgi:hypothetical protein
LQQLSNIGLAWEELRAAARKPQDREIVMRRGGGGPWPWVAVLASVVVLASADTPATRLDSSPPAFQIGAVGVAPLRPLLAWLHAASSFDDATGTLYVVLHGPTGRTALKLTVGDPTALLNNTTKVALTPAPFSAHGALYAPVRPLLEALGVKLTWSAEPRGLSLSYGEQQAFLPIMAPVYPLLDRDGRVCGGRLGADWASADMLRDKLKGGTRFWCYNLSGAGPAEGVIADSVTQPPGAPPEMPLEWPNGWVGPAVAFAGPWNAQPRLPKVVSPIPKEYEQAVADVLTDHQMGKDAVRIEQAVKIDLAGDGREVVLIVAGNLDFENPMVHAKPADYCSLLLAIVPDGTQSHVILLAGGFHPTDGVDKPEVYRLAGCLDLMATGTLQVIAASNGFDGGGLTVYQINKDSATTLLSSRARPPKPTAPTPEAKG